MSIQLIRTNSSNQDFQSLVKQLDAYLAITDGDEHGFYNQFNGIQSLNHVIVAFDNKDAVACGALKEKEGYGLEVKRMFTKANYRGKGIASKVLKELENWAKELKSNQIILETGKRQVEAVKFYQKCNYKIIANYPPYEEMENSVCFSKKL